MNPRPNMTLIGGTGVGLGARLWENRKRSMDPSRKRAIRLTVALTAALLLASALDLHELQPPAATS